MPASEVPIPRHLQLLWGRVDTGRRGPKPTLTIDDIGTAAVHIADADGLDAVSMKAVAGALGMTTMSLYRYVGSKDDLYQVMLDAAYGPADPRWTATGEWRSRLDRWAREVAGALLRRQWMVLVPMNQPPVTPNVLSWTECGLQSFESTALTGQERLSSLLLVDGFVRHHVRQSIQLGAVDDSGEMAADDGSFERSIVALADDGRHPLLVSAARSTQTEPGHFYAEELTFGLEVIFDGLTQRIG
jgi:AcrR family transcriptional regulator